MTATPPINACGTDLLRRFFALMDEHAIRYCVLHSYEALPDALPTDLDTAVHPSDVGRLTEVFRSLADCGYIPAQQIGYSVKANYFVFGWTEGERSRHSRSMSSRNIAAAGSGWLQERN